VVSLPEVLAHPEWNKRKSLPDGVLEKHGRFYIPSRIADNEHLNEVEYRATLMHLPAVEREQLMNGDWSVQEEGKFHVEWLRYFVEGDGQVELLEPGGRILAVIPERECRRYVTIDPAGTSEEAAREKQGWSPSWSVVQVWDQPPAELAKFLLLRHEVRQRVGFETLCEIIRQVHREWRPLKIWIEGEKLGLAAISILKNELPIESVSAAIKDKVSRAARLIVKMERGEIFLPRYETTWRPKFEQELLAWTGHEREVCDQIDAAAHAANQLDEEPKGPIRMRMGAVAR
jgi:predicted phage terminase large subunit-like protein